jgi:hypothetical protein
MAPYKAIDSRCESRNCYKHETAQPEATAFKVESERDIKILPSQNIITYPESNSIFTLSIHVFKEKLRFYFKPMILYQQEQ